MTDIVNVTGLKCPFQIIEVQKYVRGKKDMSKVMKSLKNDFNGKCDFQKASELVKNKLANKK